MATPYIGNNDYRGYLNYLSQNGDSRAGDLLNAVGNDGKLNSTYNGYGGNISFNKSPNQYTSKQLQDLNNSYVSNYSNGHLLGDTSPTGNVYANGGSGSSTNTPTTDFSLFDSNASNLNDLLGRTNTSLDQGLNSINDQYNSAVTGANNDKTTQVNAQNTQKQGAYDKINQNAGIGYKSLANIIGRAAGTGSSAFQSLLPDVVGKDTSSKRLDTTNTYGQNLSNIDTSFEGVLQDLLNQKKQNEDTLRTGVETQRQGIQQQLQQNAIAKSQAAGQTPAQASAAAQPFQTAITNSRNAVDSFFNQFKPDYSVATPDANLAQYQTDPAAVSAGQQGSDPTNPYGTLLRKKLQGAI